MHQVCRVGGLSSSIPLVFRYLTVAHLLLASIVRQGYIYKVRVHRLKPIESSMRLAVA